MKLRNGISEASRRAKRNIGVMPLAKMMAEAKTYEITRPIKTAGQANYSDIIMSIYIKPEAVIRKQPRGTSINEAWNGIMNAQKPRNQRK